MAEYILTSTDSSIIDFYCDDEELADTKPEQFFTAGDALLLLLDNIKEERLSVDELAAEQDNYNSNIIGIDIIDNDETSIIGYTFTIKAIKHSYDRNRKRNKRTQN